MSEKVSSIPSVPPKARPLTSSEAIKMYTKNLEMFRNSCVDQLSLRSEVYYREGKYAKCVADYSAILELIPRPDVIWNRSICYDRLFKYDLEIKDLTFLITKFPNSEHLHLYFQNRGRAFYQIGNYSRSVEDTSLAIRIVCKKKKNKDTDGILMDLYFLRGNSYEGLGEYQLAIFDSEKILQLSRTNVVNNDKLYGSYLNLGNCYKKMKNYEEAVKSYEHALSYNIIISDENDKQTKNKQSENTVLYDDRANFNLGICFFEMNKFQESLDFFKKVRDPSMTEDVIYYFYQIYLEYGDYLLSGDGYSEEREELAIKYYRKADEYIVRCINIRPDYFLYKIYRGDLMYFKLKKYISALESYKSSLELSANNEEAENHRPELIRKIEEVRGFITGNIPDNDSVTGTKRKRYGDSKKSDSEGPTKKRKVEALCKKISVRM